MYMYACAWIVCDYVYVCVFVWVCAVAIAKQQK